MYLTDNKTKENGIAFLNKLVGMQRAEIRELKEQLVAAQKQCDAIADTNEVMQTVIGMLVDEYAGGRVTISVGDASRHYDTRRVEIRRGENLSGGVLIEIKCLRGEKK